MKKCLIKFGYLVNDMQAMQILYTLDTNRDGHISYQEFNAGIRQFAAVFPRVCALSRFLSHLLLDQGHEAVEESKQAPLQVRS